MGRIGFKRGFNQITTILVVGLLTCQFSDAVARELINRLVAEVNGEAILASDVESKVKNGPLVVVSPYPAEEDAPAEKLALYDAINFKLVLQRAEELEINVTDDALEEEIQRFLKSRNLSRQALMSALAEQNMTFEQYQADFRNQLILNQFQGREILPSVKITDKQVEDFYLNKVGDNLRDVKLTLRQLFVSLPTGSLPTVVEGKEELVEKIRQELADGLKFEKAVRIYSDDAEMRESGGLMPPLFLNDMAPRFQEAIRSLEVGDYSSTVATDTGYYLFFVEAKKFAGSKQFDELRPRLEAEIRQKQIRERTNQWLSQRRRTSDIKIIVE